MNEGTWTLEPCPRQDVQTLVSELGIRETTATVLVRRGYTDAGEARAFLAAEPPDHPPGTLGAMAEACEVIKRVVADDLPIVVHGDYDADGICATVLAVLVLRELGADVRWHLPSRFEEGYGVARETLARLSEEAAGLVLTVDCGISAVEEVKYAKSLGLDVIVTDHHRPGDTLPGCPLVVTQPSDYPFPELCGTGVVYKLGEALLGRDRMHEHVDLVAIATVADVVPLLDENRAFVAAGLRRLARTSKPGLRALMKASRVDPARVDAGAIGFRIAPRINASGRLGHPAVALELLLSNDEVEAERLAARLEQLNRDRQAIEDRILHEALEQIDARPAERTRARAYVLSSQDWHRGVIGVVASRLVERFHRPVILIAGSEEEWTGSGRSIPAFDLHRGLRECSSHLERWGGHRAAAGLSIRPEHIDEFTAAFQAHANSVLSDDDLTPLTRVDAVVHGSELTLDLCDELEQLAPFGFGNPGVTLLAIGCTLSDLTAVGEGKHLRLAIHANGVRSSGIAFGQGSRLDRYRRPGSYDVAFRLGANEWNGTVAPQLLVKRIFETPEEYQVLRDRLVAEWQAGENAWSPESRAVFTELGLLGRPDRWRPLVESETFRRLIAASDDEVLRAA